MSTLRVSTIQDTAGSNSSTPAAIANGIAKAWVNFNGTGVVAIRAQYNVSSITDNGVGDYTVNFTTAMTDANYSVVSESNADGVFSSSYLSILSFSTQTASSVRLMSSGDYPSGGINDKSTVSVAIFR